jgi:uncharacterized delta-60 repeat protein
VQPDGKLVVAGTSSGDGVNHVLLVRYLPDGRGDGSFGSGGKITTTVGSHSRANAMLQQPDGKLVVAGSVVPSPEGLSDVLLARFFPDGRLDAAFGTAGSVTTHFVANNFEEANALLLQPDAKLVVAGRSDVLGTPFPSAILARYLPDGRLDPSFGIEGKVTLTFGGGSGINALVQQPDGKLVAAGFGGLSRVTASFLVLARFQPDGRLDPTFGEGGKVTLASAGGGQALIQQPDGTLVVAGSFSTSSGSGLLLVRYLPDGRLDPAFGAGGLVITDVGGRELPGALLQQPNGTLVAAGSFSASGATDILLARYQALGCPTGDPEPCQAALAAFVTDVYLVALERQPDAGEVDDWVDVLATEPTPDTVRNMLHGVFDGSEFRQRPVNPWQYVDALYQALLGRDPAPAELDWWVQAVLDRFNTVLPELLDSSEFQRLVPSCQDQAAVTLLVERLYQQVLRRGASAEELAWWTQDIVTRCAVQGAVEVFFNSLEYLSVPRTLADHVTVLYRALLAREPDMGGLTWWVGDLAGQLAMLEDDIMATPEFETHVYRLFP